MSAVLLVANPILHNKTKHFELDLHFVRERVNQNQLSIIHISAVNQVADIFTKSLNFSMCKDKLKVTARVSPSLRGDIGDMSNS